MTRYVVVVWDNDFGEPAALYDSLEAAKRAVWEDLADPERNPPLDQRALAQVKNDLDEIETVPGFVWSIRGSDAWKETILIAELDEGEDER